MTENLNLAIESLHLEPEKFQKDYLCQNFKIYPEEKEINGGYLFGLIELVATPREEAEKIMTIIVNTLKNDYYQQIVASPSPNKLNLETIFEFSLNKTNQRLLELIQIGQINLLKENLNYLIGIAKPGIDETQVIFSNYGLVDAYLLHQSKKNITKLILLTNNDGHQTSGNNRVKIFSDIICGSVGAKDTLIICTDSFSNFISPNKLKHVLQNSPLVDAMNYFRSLIKTSTYKPSSAFSALLLKKISPVKSAKNEVSFKSIDSLITNTEKTEKLLSPTTSFNFKHFIGKFSKLTKNKTAGLKKIIFAPFKLLMFIGQLFFFIIKNAYLLICGRQKISWKQLVSSEKNLQLNSSSTTSTTMPKTNKFIIAGIIVLIIALISGIFWVKNQSARKAEEKQYTQQMQSVKNLLSEAEASFIIKDKNTSLTKIQTAVRELEYLPQATTVQQSNYQDLNAQIQEIKNKIFGIEKIVPQMLVELTVDGAPLKTTQLMLVNNDLFSYGASKNLLAINLPEKKIAKIIETPSPIQLAANVDNKSYFLTDDNELYEIIENQLVKLSYDDTTVPTDFKIYNGNLYLLYKDKQQIEKRNSTVDGFAAGNSWIKSGQIADLSIASSLAIDGTIYVLNKNGEIMKFYAGNREELVNQPIEPQLTNATGLQTLNDSENIYFFEAESKRLVILNKSGELVKQLIFESLPEISDIIVTGDGSKGYLLSENKIYQFTL